jgi:chromosome partitioning protein
VIVGLINSKGGVGKSTIAVHAAAWLREQGRQVALVDADEQASSSGWFARAEPDAPLYRISDAGELFRALPRLDAAYDAVVADGPAVLDAVTFSLVGLAHVVLLPVGPSMLDVAASFRAARAIYRVKLDPRRQAPLDAFTVFNRVQPRTKMARVAAEAVVKYGFPIASNILQLRAAYAEACAAGTVVWRLGVGAQHAATEVRNLFAEVLGPRLAGASIDGRPCVTGGRPRA